MSDEDIYKAPESNLMDENNTRREQELASRWLRLGGAIIDGVIFMVLLMPIMFSLGIMDGIMEGQEPTFLMNITMMAISLLVYVVVQGYFLSTAGQTIGKRILGMRIVGYKTNQILSLSKIMSYRVLPIQLLSLIPVLGPLVGFIDVLSIFGAEKRCIHDYLAGTKVVKVQA